MNYSGNFVSGVGVGNAEHSQLMGPLKGWDEKCELGQKGIGPERSESKPEISQQCSYSKGCC